MLSSYPQPSSKFSLLYALRVLIFLNKYYEHPLLDLYLHGLYLLLLEYLGFLSFLLVFYFRDKDQIKGFKDTR